MKLHDRYIDHLFDALKVNEKGLAFDNKTTLALLEEIRASRRAREKVRAAKELIVMSYACGSTPHEEVEAKLLSDEVKEWLG